MQLKTVAGQPADIPLDEITRAASALGWAKIQSKTDNNYTLSGLEKQGSEFLHRALGNIEQMTGQRPVDEQSLKDLMYENLPFGSQVKTNLLYECIEAIVGWYGSTMLASLQKV